MLLQNKLETTTEINITRPVINIGRRPTISAERGIIKEPTQHPVMNEDPRNPMSVFDAQYKSICSTQLWRLSILSQLTSKLRPGGNEQATSCEHCVS